MPDVVEIYMCKAGQRLEDGALAVSRDIGDKIDAKADAIKRCKISPSLAQIAYYAINGDGDFKAYFSYANPKVEERKAKSNPANDGQRKMRRKKRAKRKTFWQKAAAAVGF
jgi:hypothetical protein